MEDDEVETVPGKLTDLVGRVGRLERGQAELMRSQKDQTDKLQIILDILTTSKTLGKVIKWLGGLGIGGTLLWNWIASHLPQIPGK